MIQSWQISKNNQVKNIEANINDNLETIISLIDEKLEQPLAVTVNNGLLNIKSSLISKQYSDGTGSLKESVKWKLPDISGSEILTVDSVLNVTTGELVGSFAVDTGITTQANYYRYLGIEVQTDSRLHCIWGVEGTDSLVLPKPEFSQENAFPLCYILLKKNSTTGLWGFLPIQKKDLTILKGGVGSSGGSSSSTGASSDLSNTLKHFFNDGNKEYMSMVDFNVDQNIYTDSTSTGILSEVQGAYQLQLNQFFLSKNLLDSSWDAGRRITELDIVVVYNTSKVDLNPIISVSVSGTTFNTVILERLQSTGTYYGRVQIADNINVDKIILKVQASQNNVEIFGLCVNYGLIAGEVVASSIEREEFTFSGDTNKTEFQITKFIPNPYSLLMFDAYCGKVYPGSILTINGNKVTVPEGMFDRPNQLVKVVFDQSFKAIIDSSDTNASRIGEVENLLNDILTRLTNLENL